MEPSVMISIGCTIFITMILPILLVRRLHQKDRKTLKWAVVGALVFFTTQILIRVPILQFLNFKPWYIIHISSKPLHLALFLGITAGLFEEGGRYIAVKTLLRERITWSKGLAFGIGHGGIEAILLVAIPFIQESIAQFTLGSSKLIALTPSNILLAGAERILAMTMHVGFTILVLYGIQEKKISYLLYAILAHALVDAPIVLIKSSGLLWGYLILCSLLLLAVTLSLRSKFDENLFM